MKLEVRPQGRKCYLAGVSDMDTVKSSSGNLGRLQTGVNCCNWAEFLLLAAMENRKLPGQSSLPALL